MAKLTDFLGRPHTGMVPFAVSAIVVDNVDPDELARIQVKFPTLDQEPVSFWLRQASPNAGKERGLYALPEKEDEVLVIFMQGSQDVGIIIGQFWNGVDIPPQECKDTLPGPSKTHAMKWSKDEFTDGSKDLATNDRRFWKSRSGHLFVFDDSAGAETVQIWDSTHTLAFVFDSVEKRILLTNSSGDIHIRTETDLYLEAGNDIKWKAGNDLKGEAGNNINEKAGNNYDFKAGTNVTMDSGAAWKQTSGSTMDLKAGATGSFKAGPMITIKAGMVKIN
jgi:uncharacterized protein involved in type VI secretion and phage assembly